MATHSLILPAPPVQQPKAAVLLVPVLLTWTNTKTATFKPVSVI